MKTGSISPLDLWQWFASCVRDHRLTGFSLPWEPGTTYNTQHDIIATDGGPARGIMVLYWQANETVTVGDSHRDLEAHRQAGRVELIGWDLVKL